MIWIGDTCYIDFGEKLPPLATGHFVFPDCEEWWLNGQYHRLDGPAFSSAYGRKEWWINGVHKKTIFQNGKVSFKHPFGSR